MSENPGDRGTTPEPQSDDDTSREKTGTEIKRQSGRPPARPPYEQYLRVSKVAK
jgi:hypothetical protein